MGLNVKEHRHEPSLLPYLDSFHGNLYLKLPLIHQDPTILEKTAFPFSVISDSDPLVRLIEGQIVTDAGSEVKKVFLLIQRDQYRLVRDELWPMNNRNVDDFWQNAFSFYAGEQKNSPLMVLANQINEKGGVRPLQSLFFCKTRKLFFHPPCPKCGLSLHQCENDDLFTLSRLQPYSASLKRYLYCPSCFSNGRSDFYVYELEPSDPPELKDRWALIKGFNLLARERSKNDQFPCSGCPNCEECYGTHQQVLSRILPFSFYPFYMLVFEALSLNGSDFLSLISGATFDELEARLEARQELGRLNCLKMIKQDRLAKAPFFYDRDEKSFLEILYLKLSFLGEVFQDLLPGTDFFKHPDLRFSLDRIWVKLSNHHSLLPFFWNFRVGFVDISAHPQEMRPPKLPSSSTYFFLGCVWFYALLANKKQDFSKISFSLREALDHSFSDQSFSAPPFHPVNIFWDPEGKDVNHNWLPLWEKALLLGWSIMKVSFQHDPKWSKEEFWGQFENLREEVKRHLFWKKPVESLQARPSEDTEDKSQNEAIHRILMGILNKWQSGIEVEREELKETVIFSPASLKKELPPSFKEEKEIVPETVIIKSPRSEIGLEEKVIAKEADRFGLPKKGDVLVQGDDFSAETVILGSEKEVSKPSRRALPKDFSLGEKAFPARDTKTDITRKPAEKPGEDDILSETVILGSGKVRDKEKDGKKG